MGADPLWNCLSFFLHGIILFTIKWCSQVTVTGERTDVLKIISPHIVCSWNPLMLECLTPEQNGARITVFTETALPVFTILHRWGISWWRQPVWMYNYRSMTKTRWAILRRTLCYSDPISAPIPKCWPSSLYPHILFTQSLCPVRDGFLCVRLLSWATCDMICL